MEGHRRENAKKAESAVVIEDKDEGDYCGADFDEDDMDYAENEWGERESEQTSHTMMLEAAIKREKLDYGTETEASTMLDTEEHSVSTTTSSMGTPLAKRPRKVKLSFSVPKK